MAVQSHIKALMMQFYAEYLWCRKTQIAGCRCHNRWINLPICTPARLITTCLSGSIY